MTAREEGRDPVREGATEALGAKMGELAVRAVEVLGALMMDTEQKPELRMKAAESILSRACGRSGVADAGGEGLSVTFEGALEEWSR